MCTVAIVMLESFDIDDQPPERVREVRDVTTFNHIFSAGEAVCRSCIESRPRTPGWSNAGKLE